MSFLWKLNIWLFKQRIKFTDNLDLNKKTMIEFQHGLIWIDGEPKRCLCGCKEFYDDNKDYHHGMILEYTVKCKNCNLLCGAWSYGYWML